MKQWSKYFFVVLFAFICVVNAQEDGFSEGEDVGADLRSREDPYTDAPDDGYGGPPGGYGGPGDGYGDQYAQRPSQMKEFSSWEEIESFIKVCVEAFLSFRK
jgi:hypothetical protein